MRNRAKCKLCNDIIESDHKYGEVLCKCGEIFVSNAEEMRCGANDWSNFMRIDDQGNEIIVKVLDVPDKADNTPHKPDKRELLGMLESMIKNIEALPQGAMLTSINHYDLCSALLLLLSIFRADCKEEN